ncbi:MULTISPECIES: MFS transporter [unclassified Streptomyces]|uniref:MFS transporter n=1 Tax=unclassified Streptomyces TaxID=2593676 RepID=UPI000F44F6A2|nr:MFS transporter [Streptomyces sp. I6]RNL73851.1 MFS transporter [Streptomyces sp. I6]
MSSEQPSMPGRSHGSKERLGTLLAAYTGLFVVNVNVLITYVGIFDMQRRLGMGESDLQWLVGVYSIGMASATMISATLADVFGRKTVYVVSLCVYVACSLVAATTSSVLVLVVARGAQGVSAAAVIVTSLALVSGVSTTREARTKAVGTWVAVGSVAVALGPPVGGVLAQLAGWRGLFAAAVPLCLAVLLLTLRFVPRSERAETRAFDWTGQFFFVLTVASMAFVMIQGPSFGWRSGVTLSLFGLSVLGFLVFVVRESRARHPMLDVSLFRNRLYALAVAAVFFAAFCNEGAFFVVMQYYRRIREYSPIEVGFLVLPFAVGYAVVALKAAALRTRFGLRRLLLCGQAGLLLGLLAMVFGFPVGRGTVLLGMAVVGMASAMVITPVVALVLEVMPSDRSGMASGIVNTQQPLGGAMSFAALGTVMTVWLGVTLGRDIERVIPDPAERLGASRAIILHADPHTHVSMSAPGVQIRHFDARLADIAERNFIQAGQVSLGVAALAAAAVLAVLLAAFPGDADHS